MKTIFVGTDTVQAGLLFCGIRKHADIELISRYSNGRDALAFAAEDDVDLVILGNRIKGMDGVYFAACLRKICPDVQMIILSDDEAGAMTSIRLHAAGYLVGIFTERELDYALETARLLSKRNKRSIFVRTFGHFDVFVNRRPIMFRSGKAKELLALLIDRQGGTVSTDQVICALWEERPNDEATQNLCSKVSHGLYRELSEYGAQDIFIANRGIRRVDTELFECDLYDFLDGKTRARMAFSGDYMLDYSWAEERMGQLARYIS